LRKVLVEPSPKSQVQDVGFPEEVSVNCTDSPVDGYAGLCLKEAVSDVFVASITAIVRRELRVAEPLTTVRTTR
jgi:hypothetical protein